MSGLNIFFPNGLLLKVKWNYCWIYWHHFSNFKMFSFSPKKNIQNTVYHWYFKVLEVVKHKCFVHSKLWFDVDILAFFEPAIVLATFSKNWANFIFNHLVTLINTLVNYTTNLIVYYATVLITSVKSFKTLSTFVKFHKFFTFVNLNWSFFWSILVSIKFKKFWSHKMKAMAKNKKSILLLPSCLWLNLTSFS